MTREEKSAYNKRWKEEHPGYFKAKDVARRGTEKELERHRKRHRGNPGAYKAYNLKRYYEKQRRERICFQCSLPYSTGSPDDRDVKPLCPSCLRTGPNNPTWRGGQENWAIGRKGADSEGLQWAKQRLLALERDNHTCQHCQTTVLRIEVHHVVPWHYSHSHRLENLLSLCFKCHRKADAAYELNIKKAA